MIRPRARLLLPCLVALCGCQPSGDSEPASVAGLGRGPSLAETAERGPEPTVRGFFDAVRSGDPVGPRRFLTEPARSGFADGGFQLSGDDIVSVEVDRAAVDGDEARVPVALETRDADQDLAVLLRRDGGEWLVWGMAIPMGEEEWTIDFEEAESALEALGEEIAQGMAEGIAEGMQQAFETAMADWQAGGSPEEIAAERASFDELDSLSVDEFRATCRSGVAGKGRARGVLHELLEGSGLELDEGEHGARLDREVSLELTSLSRIQALEAVCAEVGLVPVYPGGSFDLGASRTLSFRAGPRGLPVAFAGPFLVEVAELEEVAPHTTGSLTLAIRALGLHPSSLATNRDLAEFLRVEELEGPGGTSLVPNEDTRYMGEPTLVGNLFSYSLTTELRGLVRGVTHLDVAGEVLFRVPVQVREVRFDPLVEGTVSGEGWAVACKSADEQSRFEVTQTGWDTESVAVRFAPEDEIGDPMGILWNSSMEFGDEVHLDLQTPAVPARVALKICETERESLSFALEGVPLARFEEQPERLQTLAFEGPAPLAITFQRFGDASNPDFPQVRLVVRNLANKDALQVQATFEYLDADGRPQESFPHTLTGSFGFEGAEPLAPSARTVEQETVAFFMPDGTASVRVVVDSVEFIDGTVWQRN